MRQHQKVICLSSDEWTSDQEMTFIQRVFFGKRKVSGPKKDEIVTIASVQPDGYLILLEYSGLVKDECIAYNPESFAEIMSTYELESELNEIFKKA